MIHSIHPASSRLVPVFLLTLCLTVFAAGCKKKDKEALDPAGAARSGDAVTILPLPTQAILDGLGPKNDLDLNYSFPDTLFLLAGQPKKFLASPAGRGNEQFISANLAQSLFLPFNFSKIERFTLAFAPAVVNAMFQENGQQITRPTLMFRRCLTAVFDSSIDKESVLAPVLAQSGASIETLKRTAGTVEYYDLTDPGKTGPQKALIHFIDDRTLVLAECFEQDINALFSPLKSANAVIERAKRIDFASTDLAVVASREGTGIRPMDLYELLRSAQELPPDLLSLLTENFLALTLALKLEIPQDQPMLELFFECVDEKGAEAVKVDLEGRVLVGQTTLAAMEAAPALPISSQFASKALAAMRAEVAGKTVRFVIDKFEGFDEAFASGMTTQRETAIRMQTMQGKSQQLAFLAQAYSAYYQQHKKFPSTIRSEDGKPLLSWRVDLLPVIGFQELHEKFKLDEPWDSETNKALLAEMPQLFTPIGEQVEPNKTLVRRFNSEGTPFSKPELKAEDIKYPQMTLLLVSVLPGQAIEWTRPDELAFEVDKLDSVVGNSLLGVFFSGRIDMISLLPASDPRSAEQRRFLDALVKGVPLPEMLQALQQQMQQQMQMPQGTSPMVVPGTPPAPDASPGAGEEPPQVPTGSLPEEKTLEMPDAT